jgi:hypothetical protein
MKHLKLFESYFDNIIPSKPNYYERITWEEKEDLLGSKWINELIVNDKYINKLRDLGYEATHYANGEPIPEKGKKWNKQWRHKYKSIFIKYNDNDIKFSPQSTGGSKIRVYEVPDEWFILEIDDRYNTSGYFHHYKCDQFEGLLECLKDNQIGPTK